MPVTNGEDVNGLWLANGDSLGETDGPYEGEVRDMLLGYTDGMLEGKILETN